MDWRIKAVFLACGAGAALEAPMFQNYGMRRLFAAYSSSNTAKTVHPLMFDEAKRCKKLLLFLEDFPTRKWGDNTIVHDHKDKEWLRVFEENERFRENFMVLRARDLATRQQEPMGLKKYLIKDDECMVYKHRDDACVDGEVQMVVCRSRTRKSCQEPAPDTASPTNKRHSMSQPQKPISHPFPTSLPQSSPETPIHRSASTTPPTPIHPPTTPTPTATMKRNIVIFLIILILFILIALIAYLIYYLQTRMAVGGTASSVSDMTEP
ncbi:hypothetical protein EK21DRAFT_93110 [Setomelanomma holmii]|uniref:Uncharacterized protein n=1 Tax=Setomelanomma holmii TaxID=210430 RepID=A0A9P4H0V8_9PLEO|nr:hypothetical protein EK21DRAFT_93110 [Setomelanomma holmii]